MYYQLTYLVPSSISDFDQLEKIIASVNSLITEVGGKLNDHVSGTSGNQMSENSVSSEELKKIAARQKVSMFKHRLAYTIKKHNFGFYISNVYDLGRGNSGAVLKKIDSALKANENIIRFITVNFDLNRLTRDAEQRKKAKAGVKTEKISDATGETTDTTQGTAFDEESKKTKIEDLDKKLEQILNA